MTGRAGLVLAAGGLAGCAVQTYAGPRRPTQEVAVIETDGTQLTSVDAWRAARSDRKLEVLPGPHALGVKLSDDHRHTVAGDGYHYFTRYSLFVCFVAYPGHTYLTRPVYSGRTWRPEIVDENRAELIKIWMVESAASGCRTDEETQNAGEP
jgi:hypothetical protein